MHLCSYTIYVFQISREKSRPWTGIRNSDLQTRITVQVQNFPLKSAVSAIWVFQFYRYYRPSSVLCHLRKRSRNSADHRSEENLPIVPCFYIWFIKTQHRYRWCKREIREEDKKTTKWKSNFYVCLLIIIGNLPCIKVARKELAPIRIY